MQLRSGLHVLPNEQEAEEIGGCHGFDLAPQTFDFGRSPFARCRHALPGHRIPEPQALAVAFEVHCPWIVVIALMSGAGPAA